MNEAWVYAIQPSIFQTESVRVDNKGRKECAIKALTMEATECKCFSIVLYSF